MRKMIPIVLALAAVQAFSPAAQSQTLKTVQDRGSLVCGVNPGLEGFASKDADGQWSGFRRRFLPRRRGGDLRRPVKGAICAVVRFGPLRRAEEQADRPLVAQFELDDGSRRRQWRGVYGRDLLRWAGVSVPKSKNFQSALELDGSKVCVQPGTTTELNFVDFFEANHMKYETVHEASADDMIAAYEAGQCNVLTTDASGLFAMRLRLAKPADNMILPDIISKEPLGPAVRQDDMQWFNIVKWVNFAMLNAEELGVSSKTIDDALKSQKPAVKRLVGTDGDFGKPFGLSGDWAVRIVRAVGNYAEVFDRNVGAGSKLGIPRGLNELWSNGGIQYAPPIR